MEAVQVQQLSDRKPGRSGLPLYLAMAYGGGYLLEALALHLAGSAPPATFSALPFLVAAMWMPTLAAALAYRVEGRTLLRELRGSLVAEKTWVLAAPLLVATGYGVALLLAALCGYRVSLHACGYPLSPPLAAVLVLAALVAGITVNAIVALGEEIGWRGYLLEALLRRLGLEPAVVLDGLVWGLWHLPLIYRGYDYYVPGCGGATGGVAAVAAFLAFTVSLTALLVPLRLRGGLYAAAAGHGTVNSLAGLAAAVVAGPRLAAPPAGLLVSLGFALVALPFYLVAAGRE